MIITSLALATAAAFTGAAAYINWSEQIVSGLLGLAAFFFEHRLMAGVGGVLMLANWPYTVLAINPTNKRLGAMADSGAGSRPLIEKWGRLHAVRTLLGGAGLCAFWFAQVTA